MSEEIAGDNMYLVFNVNHAKWENVVRCLRELPGGLTRFVVGFTVDPDQWCRHDRSQT